MAYNAITRGNRVLNARLDAFAFELMTFLSMGSPLADKARQDKPAATAPVQPLRTASA
jgi:biopolymer transport protein ExbB